MQSRDWLEGDDSNKKEKAEGHQNIIKPCGLPQYQAKSTQSHNDSQLMGLIHKTVGTVAQNSDLKTGHKSDNINWVCIQ